MKKRTLVAKIVSVFLIIIFMFLPKILVYGQNTNTTNNSGNNSTNTTNNSGNNSTNTTNNSGGGDVNLNVKLENPIKADNIGSFIEDILDIVLKIGIPIVTVFIIYSGFLFVTAQGNPAKLTAAKEALLYTLIGAAVLLGAWVIASAIQGTVQELQG